MRLGWTLVVVPVLGYAGLQLVGDRVFDVRPAAVPRPADAPPVAADEQVRLAFVGPTPQEPVEPQLADFLLGVGTAAQAFRASDVADAFDCDRLHDEVARSDAFTLAGLRPDPVAGPKAVRAALWSAAHEGGPGLAWDRVEVRRVVPLPSTGEVLVYAKHTSGRRSALYRWWVVRRGDGLRAFDVEDVRVGLRLSRQAAGLFARGAGGEVPAEVVAGVKALRASSEALAGGDAAAADAALAPARSATLPRETYVLRCVLEGATAAMLGRGADALAWADRADAVSPDLPAVDYLRASAHAVAGHWPQAARSARRYVERLGPDASACRILGAALRATGRPAEAAEAYRLGLRDDPTREDLRAALLDLGSVPER